MNPTAPLLDLLKALPIKMSKATQDEIANYLLNIATGTNSKEKPELDKALIRFPVLQKTRSILEKLSSIRIHGAHAFTIRRDKKGLLTWIDFCPTNKHVVRIYPPLFFYALIILDCFRAGYRFIRISAFLQSGKTTLVQVLGILSYYCADEIFEDTRAPSEVCFFNTNPSKDLYKQDISRLGPCHIEVWKKFDRRKGNGTSSVLDHSLAVADETHWGTIAGGLTERNFEDLLRNGTVCLTVISATDYNTKYAWLAKFSKTVRFSPKLLHEYGYWGLWEALEEGNVIDNGGTSPINVHKNRKTGEETVSFNPLFETFMDRLINQSIYHLGFVRAGSEVKCLHLEDFIRTNYPSVDIVYHNQHEKMDDEALASTKKHTVVLLKQLLRVGITLPDGIKQNLYAVWGTGTNVTSHMQELPGRIPGYRFNKHIKIFCSKTLLETYLNEEGFPLTRPENTGKLHPRVDKWKIGRGTGSIMDVTEYFPKSYTDTLIGMNHSKRRRLVVEKINSLHLPHPFPEIDKILTTLGTWFSTSKNERAADVLNGLNTVMPGSHDRNLKEDTILVVNTGIGMDSAGRPIRDRRHRVLLQVDIRKDFSPETSSKDVMGNGRLEHLVKNGAIIYQKRGARKGVSLRAQNILDSSRSPKNDNHNGKPPHR